MKLQKTFIAGVVAVACTALLTTPVAVAKGNGQAALSAPALVSAESDALRYMREEEKLARDAYITLYRQWKLPVFDNIAGAEQRHTDRIKLLVQTYGLADPVVDDAVGVFTNTHLSALYAQLLAKGKTSALAALQAGALIEETDIADLQKALKGTAHPDITAVYGNLIRGSRNHLRAFVGLIKSQNVAYTAQALPQAEVDAIANSPRERGNGGNGPCGNGGGRGQGGGMGRRW